MENLYKKIVGSVLETSSGNSEEYKRLNDRGKGYIADKIAENVQSEQHFTAPEIYDKDLKKDGVFKAIDKLSAEDKAKFNYVMSGQTFELGMTYDKYKADLVKMLDRDSRDVAFAAKIDEQRDTLLKVIATQLEMHKAPVEKQVFDDFYAKDLHEFMHKYVEAKTKDAGFNAYDVDNITEMAGKKLQARMNLADGGSDLKKLQNSRDQLATLREVWKKPDSEVKTVIDAVIKEAADAVSKAKTHKEKPPLMTENDRVVAPLKGLAGARGERQLSV